MARRRALPARRVLRLRASGAEGFATATLSPAAARWDTTLGEYILDWEDVRAGPDPTGRRSTFVRSAVAHACQVCGWNVTLAASMEGKPPPIA